MKGVFDQVMMPLSADGVENRCQSDPLMPSVPPPAAAGPTAAATGAAATATAPGSVMIYLRRMLPEV